MKYLTVGPYKLPVCWIFLVSKEDRLTNRTVYLHTADHYGDSMIVISPTWLTISTTGIFTFLTNRNLSVRILKIEGYLGIFRVWYFYLVCSKKHLPACWRLDRTMSQSNIAGGTSPPLSPPSLHAAPFLCPPPTYNYVPLPLPSTVFSFVFRVQWSLLYTKVSGDPLQC